MPSSMTLQHAIENIAIWRKGEQRAPHKPLLLLYVLSQYQRGHVRMFDYTSEIRDELHSLAVEDAQPLQGVLTFPLL
ncbi:hypothetical protein T643_A5238 [Klebsiella pneumoniae MRSN 1319]|nr:hypothetical protein T643_A5238 [Klebsiella pneumoniae MRSN 1319]